MKSNQICSKEALQQVGGHWNILPHLFSGEWSMQEEAYLHVVCRVSELFSEILRQQHKMVVVYPYDISPLYMRSYLLGEETVDSLVGYISCVVGMD